MLLLFVQSTAQGSFAETWTVPNATGTLDGDFNWDDHIGTHQWNVVSQAIQLVAGGGTNGGHLATDFGDDDHSVTAVIEEWHDTGSGILAFGPMARMQGDTSFTGYAATLVTTAGVTKLILQRFVSGVAAQLGSEVSVTPHAGMTVTTRVQADSIAALFDGATLIVQTDTLIPTGSFAGLEGFVNGGNRIRVTSLTASSGAAILPTTVGTFALTGQAASPRAARRLPATVAAFTETGSATALRPAHRLTATVGVFTLTGGAVNFAGIRTLAAAAGSFALTGSATVFRRARIFSTAAGAFTLAGPATAFRHDYRLTATVASLALTGNPAALDLQGQFSIAPPVVAFTLAAPAVGLRISRRLPATVIDFALTGNAAALRLDRPLQATPGALTVTGIAALLRASHVIPAAVSSLTLTGTAATLRRTYQLTATSRAFTLTGAPAGSISIHRLQAAGTTYVLTGSAAGLNGSLAPASFVFEVPLVRTIFDYPEN